MTKTVIVGAGPAGLLAAHYLLQRPNNQVEIYEKREDYQNLAFQSDRSFPIALQSRGLGSIRGCPGLEAALEGGMNSTTNDDDDECNGGVWTVGMSFHRGASERKIDRPPSLSVERNYIVSTFLRELYKVTPAQNSSLTVCFDSAVMEMDVSNKTLQVKKRHNDGTAEEEMEETVSYDVLVVSDGARSKLRQILVDKGLMTAQQTITKDQYKSFYISRTSEDGAVELDGERVHGWMFGENRVISVPTRKHESAGVFIFPEGKDPFSNLPDAGAVIDYIRSLSPDSLAHLVNLEEAESLRTRPVCSLVEATCNKLVINTDIVLLGDAAHAVSASLGQGCNSALQDVQVLVECLDQYDGDWTKALPAYNQQRLPEAHAVWELSSFNNPRTRFMRFEFIVRVILSSLLPKWISSILLKPMPQQLLSEPNLSYSDVLDKCRWWTDRVKSSS